jgi:K+-sensing histidine kinase KdpD
LYFASVAIAAWYGGFAPAMVATVSAYFAADWFFITPRFEISLPHENLDEFLALIAFVFSCFAIAITSSIMRGALARARHKQRELENEIAERQRAEQALQQAQAQLRQYAEMLEERVEERTAHLHETIRSLEGVCYHLAHDLRAPLRAMEGFSAILLKESIGHIWTPPRTAGRPRPGAASRVSAHFGFPEDAPADGHAAGRDGPRSVRSVSFD